MKKSKTPFLLKVVQSVYPVLERWAPPLAHRFFTKIFFTPLNYPVPEKEKVVEAQAEKFTITVRNKRIQCYAWGSGPVILLVHGWAGRATQFRKIIQALRENFRVVGFDGPAHGRSQGTSTDIREFAEVLEKLYEHVGPPKAIIAHSFGGGAVLYAAMNGLTVPKLINIASPTIGDEIIATYLKRVGASPATATFFKSYIFRTTGQRFDDFTALHFAPNIDQKIDLMLVHDEDDDDVSIAHALALKKIYPQAVMLKTQGLGHTRILKDEGVVKACVSFVSH